MSTQNTPTSPAVEATPPPATGGLPSYPRQTPPGHYGPRRYGPNGCAMWSFTIGLVGGIPISVILGVIALGKIRDTGQSGRGLAIAGLVLSALWLPIEIFAFLNSAK